MALILFLQTNINIPCEHWKFWYANSSNVIRVFKGWWRPMRTLQMRAQANILTNPITLGGRDQTNFTVFQVNCHSRKNQACCNEISTSHRVSAGRVISDYSTRWLPSVFWVKMLSHPEPLLFLQHWKISFSRPPFLNQGNRFSNR